MQDETPRLPAAESHAAVLERAPHVSMAYKERLPTKRQSGVEVDAESPTSGHQERD
jgi:hypothetical protein